MKLSDPMKHTAACALVALTASGVLAGAGAGAAAVWLGGFMAGMAIGIGKEYGDHCAAGNRWDWADIAFDALGATAGATIAVLAIQILF